MTKTVLVSIAVLILSASAVSAAQHRTHHRQAMNANARLGAPPVAGPTGMSSGDHATYMRNLRDSGYDPKNDFTAAGTLKTQ
jgi:hypothetical protein